MKINTTSVQQTANEVLGTAAKSLYYLIVENALGKKLIVNVGQKTHDEVKKLVQEEEDSINKDEATVGQPELPIVEGGKITREDIQKKIDESNKQKGGK